MLPDQFAGVVLLCCLDFVLVARHWLAQEIRRLREFPAVWDAYLASLYAQPIVTGYGPGEGYTWAVGAGGVVGR